MYRATLGILRYLAPELQKSNFEQMMQLLSHLPKNMDEDKLFDCIFAITLSPKRFLKARNAAKKHVAQLAKQGLI